MRAPRTACTVAGIRTASTLALFQGLVDIRSREPHGWQETREDSREECQEQGESKHLRVECNFRGTREPVGEEFLNQDNAKARQEKPDRAAREREKQCLRKNLAQHRGAAGTERRPDRHFFLSCESFSKHQIGDIGACNQEHESHRA